LAKEQGINGFKASHRWIMRFFTRNELCIRRKTSVSQRLLNAYEEKILCFQKYNINLWQQHSYTVSQTHNAEQIPVYFEMPLDTTVHKKGDKNVTVRTGGNEKQRCTVMLCNMADGRKLPPYMVLKMKTVPKVNVKGVIIQAQESGWMDQALVLDWINRVWQQHPGALLNLRSMLILDSFHGHTIETVYYVHLYLRKKIKFFIKFTFLKIFNFFFLKTGVRSLFEGVGCLRKHSISSLPLV
jgi:hypothetical protein